MSIRTRVVLLFAIICCVVSGAPVNTIAQTVSQVADDAPIVTLRDNGVEISWLATQPHDAQRAIGDMVPSWPLTQIGDVMLPAHLMTFAVDADIDVQPMISQIDTRIWRGRVQVREAIVPQTIDGELLPDLTEQLDPRLPSEPLLILDDYVLRGQRFVVLALVPVFEQAGEQKTVRSLSVTIAGAKAYNGDGSELFEQTGPIITQANAPTNPLVNQAALKILTSQPGIQRVTGEMLSAAGWNLAAIDPSKIQLFNRGVELAIELRLGGDAKFDAQDELRFYSAAEGNRWSNEDIYWLVVGSSAGKRMISRNTVPSGASVRTTAYQAGSSYTPKEYITNAQVAGLDGDHWFVERLVMNPDWDAAGIAENFKIFSLTLTPTLSLASGTTVVTVTGSSDVGFQPTIEATLGSQKLERTWTMTPTNRNWLQAFSFTQTSPNLKLNLKLGTQDARIFLDRIYWHRPVNLQFANRGDFFDGVGATYTYQLSGVPAQRSLYDISDPNNPQILSLDTNNRFQDGPSARRYVLAATGTLHTPRVQARAASNIANQINAQALYIALPEFHSALQPLLQQRQSKGYSARTVDLQGIYDGWSYGYIEPSAIRTFIQYAASGSIAPVAVTLVGDGTYDPQHYASLSSNVTTLPPYLLPVDPRLGETACDTCYVQIDGADPLSDTMPDIYIGRLPIKNNAELIALVNKIIGYERVSNGMDWRSRALIVSDNYLGKNSWRDLAGDFWAAADSFASWMPNKMQVQRMYYDLSGTKTEPWYEANPTRARERIMQGISQGNAIVAYVGHSHWWQWASTELEQLNPPSASAPSYLLNIYDIDSLTNEDKLSIVLGMTCLTGSFHVPSAQATSFDERLMLQKGGAIATWGSSGMAVLVGHDKLMEGFMNKLRAQPQATMGNLTFSGYQWLLSNSGCCRDLVRTFIVLGDPLTNSQVQNAQRLYLPVTKRQ